MAGGQRTNHWCAHDRAVLTKTQAKSTKTRHYKNLRFPTSDPMISACYARRPLSNCRRSVQVERKQIKASSRAWGEFVATSDAIEVTAEMRSFPITPCLWASCPL